MSPESTRWEFAKLVLIIDGRSFAYKTDGIWPIHGGRRGQTSDRSHCNEITQQTYRHHHTQQEHAPEPWSFTRHIISILVIWWLNSSQRIPHMIRRGCNAELTHSCDVINFREAFTTPGLCQLSYHQSRSGGAVIGTRYTFWLSAALLHQQWLHMYSI